MRRKPGPKRRPAGSGSVAFNVKPNAMRYLRRLVQRSVELEDADEAAQRLFFIGLRKAMETREFEIDDAKFWEPDEYFDESKDEVGLRKKEGSQRRPSAKKKAAPT